jgi:hypothetical protein
MRVDVEQGIRQLTGREGIGFKKFALDEVRALRQVVELTLNKQCGPGRLRLARVLVSEYEMVSA